MYQRLIITLAAMLTFLTIMSCSEKVDEITDPPKSNAVAQNPSVEQPITLPTTTPPIVSQIPPAPIPSHEDERPVLSLIPPMLMPSNESERAFSPFPVRLPTDNPTPADEDYIAPVSGIDFSAPGIYLVEDNVTYIIDMTGDGVPGSLTIRRPAYALDYLWGYEIVQITPHGLMWIEYNDERVDLHREWMDYGAIMRRDDGSVALFISSNDYDQPNTVILTIIDGRLRVIDSVSFRIAELDYYSMELQGNIYYFLGNQFLYGMVGLTDDFSIIYPEDGWFNVRLRTSAPRFAYHDLGPWDSFEEEWKPAFEDPEGFVIILRIDLRLKRYVNGEYEDDILFAGSYIRPRKMDIGLTRAIIEDKDRNLWLLTRNDLPSGIPEGDVFDGCTYAGQ